MGSGHHISDLLFFIDFIEKAPGSDAIPPRIRSETFEFFDIWPKMGVLTQLGVNKIAKLLSNFALAGSCDLFQIFFKLAGLEYSVSIQRSALSATVLPGSLF